MSARARNHPGYWAFLVHRLSGLALALFLPLHFWVLGSALQGHAAFDALLGWSELPLVKGAETLLVVLLSAHLAGGLRLLVLELLAWRESHKLFISLGFALALLTGLLFALRAL